MAVLTDLSGWQFGVESDETSMNIQSFVVTVAPQFKVFATDKVGANIGHATGPGRLEITLEGQITASSLGVLAFTFSAPCTLANDKTYNGVGGTGDVYLDSATYTQNNADFKTVSMRLSLDAAITGTGS